MVRTSELCRAISIKALDLRAAEGQVAVDGMALLLLSLSSPCHPEPLPQDVFLFHLYEYIHYQLCWDVSEEVTFVTDIQETKQGGEAENRAASWGQDPSHLQCCLGFALNGF